MEYFVIPDTAIIAVNRGKKENARKQYLTLSLFKRIKVLSLSHIAEPY